MSAAPGRRVSVPELRDAVRRAVAATSTRLAAESIGMSQPWLRKFLKGAEPQPATVDMLQEWYARHQRETADAALAALVDGFPKRSRRDVRESVLLVLREAHRRLGTDPPGWLVGGG